MDNITPSNIKHRHFTCKNCQNERKRHYKPHTKVTDLNYQLQWKYGVSLEDYNNMLKAQNHSCAICGRPETAARIKRLSVDHNHSTGKVRGLLCNTCNRALGYFKDSLEVLKSAVIYLEKDI